VANKDAPLGFRPVTGGIAGTTPQTNEYTVASSVTIYQGQPVCLVSGVVNTFVSANRLDVLGVAAHSIKAADTTRTLRVYDDPAQEFIVQLDSAGSLVTTDAGLKGLHFPAVNVTSGNATLMLSIAELDSSAGTNTNNSTTMAVWIGKKFSSRTDNDQTVSWGEVIVQCEPNNHIFGPSLAAT
jgi:hypothetical protein